MLGIYLTVTSIGVCDGGECFYPMQTIQHVSADTAHKAQASGRICVLKGTFIVLQVHDTHDTTESISVMGVYLYNPLSELNNISPLVCEGHQGH